jgi:hypothetical protein
MLPRDASYLLGTVALAVLLYAAALRMRSWPVWLLAFAVTLVALWAAWFVRDLRPA